MTAGADTANASSAEEAGFSDMPAHIGPNKLIRRVVKLQNGLQGKARIEAPTVPLSAAHDGSAWRLLFRSTFASLKASK